MASITIRRLDETTKRKLRIRAARNGHSMEQEAREILKHELDATPPKLAKPKTGADFVKAVREIFEPLGGVDLEIPPRGPIRDPGIR